MDQLIDTHQILYFDRNWVYNRLNLSIGWHYAGKGFQLVYQDPLYVDPH